MQIIYALYLYIRKNISITAYFENIYAECICIFFIFIAPAIYSANSPTLHTSTYTIPHILQKFGQNELFFTFFINIFV